MRARVKIAVLTLSLLLGWAGWRGLNALLRYSPVPAGQEGARTMEPKVKKSAAEWKKELTPEQYRVMIQCGTEPPGSGRYNDFWEAGLYRCAACEALLFDSDTKYEHHTGWPSFKAPAGEDSVIYLEDRSVGMVRTEVRCANCGAHLGHIFDDGPPPTGRHFCINSAALVFAPKAIPAAASGGPAQATFAAGCFWGVEDKFGKIPGVLETVVGYTGGWTKNPRYVDVCTDATGHAEAVRVTFDPAQVRYEDLVRRFFEFHDPTLLNRQGPDVGTQYRSVIFYHSEEQKRTAEAVQAEYAASGKFRRQIVTEIIPAPEFYPAEEYHQKYLQKKKKTGFLGF